MMDMMGQKIKYLMPMDEAMGQAERDANGHAVPLVVHRRNRKPWLVVMKLSDWLQLIGRK